MPTEVASRQKKSGEVARRDTSRGETLRFEQRLGEILEHATNVFYEKGYDAASMRDLSRATGMSLAGLYYYFESKERLLYLIQKHTFETVVESLKSRLELINDPEQKVRAFIQNHLEYFLANRKAMTVLSHEDDTLTNAFGAEVRGLKREYYRIGTEIVDELRRERGEQFSAVNTRTAVVSLFGMMNWLYTWHNPKIDGDAESLSRQMSQIFLNGILNRELPEPTSKSKPTGRKRRD